MVREGQFGVGEVVNLVSVRINLLVVEEYQKQKQYYVVSQ